MATGMVPDIFTQTFFFRNRFNVGESIVLISHLSNLSTAESYCFIVQFRRNLFKDSKFLPLLSDAN